MTEYSAEERLLELGIQLPPLNPSVANYIPFQTSGNIAFVAGQVPRVNGLVEKVGRIGEDVTPEEGYEAARRCGLNILSHIKANLGSLDRVERVLAVRGYVAAAPGFYRIPAVLDGASDLFVEVFGEKGRHARSSVGVFSLPDNVPVEVEIQIQFK